MTHEMSFDRLKHEIEIISCLFRISLSKFKILANFQPGLLGQAQRLLQPTLKVNAKRFGTHLTTKTPISPIFNDENGNLEYLTAKLPKGPEARDFFFENGFF